MVVALALLGCSTPTEAPTTEAPTPMEPERLAARIALDLVGRRPTEAELEAALADPAGMGALADAWMAEPGFEERVVSMYSDIFRSRADHYVVGADGDAEFADPSYKAQFIRSVGEEPIRLVARVAATDRPWTDIVTADWSMGNDKLLKHFPMQEIESGGSGWRPVRYLDGRPAVGVLSTNGMWWRYTSTADNRNRGRAAAISRILLCDHRYEAPVDFTTGDPSLQVGERLASDPACVGCHVTIEPMASTLYGFWRMHPESYTEALRYYPSREQDWQVYTGTPPSYYGQEAPSLYHVGRAVADDPRFISCTVEHAWGYFLGRDATGDETARVSEQRDAFIQGGLTFRALAAAMVADPWYQSDDPAWAGTTPPKRMSPDQLASAVEALTGYRWSVIGGVDAMVNDEYGFRVLNGGVDGILVTDAPESDSATIALVQERLAEAAGAYVVAHEGTLSAADRTLFRELDSLATSPSDDAARAQLAALLRRVHTRVVEADSAEVTDLLELLRGLEADTGATDTAWAHLVSALLRHPDFVYY